MGTPSSSPSLSVRPSTQVPIYGRGRTMLCPLLSAASPLLSYDNDRVVKAASSKGPSLARHKIVVESPHDLAVPYLRIHTRGTALASVHDGQMKPSDRSGN